MTHPLIPPMHGPVILNHDDRIRAAAWLREQRDLWAEHLEMPGIGTQQEQTASHYKDAFDCALSQLCGNEPPTEQTI
jgi:hypothetical protein